MEATSNQAIFGVVLMHATVVGVPVHLLSLVYIILSISFIFHCVQWRPSTDYTRVVQGGIKQECVVFLLTGLWRRKYGGGSYDLTDFDQALLFEVPATTVDLPASSIGQERQSQSLEATGMRPPTLNIFPSQPMHAGHLSPTATTKVCTSSILSPSGSGSKKLSNNYMSSNLKTDILPVKYSKVIKHDGNEKGCSSSSIKDHPKTPDTKALRRLAQNREAARKSRLRRKAYVQQLESSSIKLTLLEHELQKARTQGVYLGGVSGVLGADQGLPHGVGNVSSEAAAFNMEYAKWLEDHRHYMGRLQAAVNNHLTDDDIRFCVDDCITHFDNLMHRKSMIVKVDVFHILSGMWKTPAERCLLWIGGFRPSELIQIILTQIESLTDQQIGGIIGLRNAMKQVEANLSQELLQLYQSLSEAMVSDNLKSPNDITTYMGQMATAMDRLSEVEDIVNQADHLRQQTIHHVHELMTTHQASKSLIAISEYFNRLRVLSSFWASRK